MLSWWAERPQVHVLALLWAAFILVMSATPGRELPDVPFPHADKLAHFGVYAILAFLLCFSWKGLLTRHVLAVFFVVSLYGLAIEWMQGAYFEGRSFDLGDGLANAVGALLGIVIFGPIDRTISK